MIRVSSMRAMRRFAKFILLELGVYVLFAAIGSIFRRLYWVSIYETYRKKYTISDEFRFNGFGIQFYGDGLIICRENSYIGELSTVQSSSDANVEIGSGCSISHNVRIYTTTYVSDADFSVKPITTIDKGVVIGDNVWIGANVFICPGVSIGGNSVVGANSVVNRSVPPNEIWGGVPAKFLRSKKPEYLGGA